MALLNHSCQPNCVAVFRGCAVVVRSIAPVRAGEELTICYVDAMKPCHLRRCVHCDSLYRAGNLCCESGRLCHPLTTAVCTPVCISPVEPNCRPNTFSAAFVPAAVRRKRAAPYSPCGALGSTAARPSTWTARAARSGKDRLPALPACHFFCHCPYDIFPDMQLPPPIAGTVAAGRGTRRSCRACWRQAEPWMRLATMKLQGVTRLPHRGKYSG